MRSHTHGTTAEKIVAERNKEEMRTARCNVRHFFLRVAPINSLESRSLAVWFCVRISSGRVGSCNWMSGKQTTTLWIVVVTWLLHSCYIVVDAVMEFIHWAESNCRGLSWEQNRWPGRVGKWFLPLRPLLLHFNHRAKSFESRLSATLSHKHH